MVVCFLVVQILMRYKYEMAKMKFGNKKTQRLLGNDVIKFDSLKEASRFDELILLLKDRKISNLILQPEFILQEPFIRDGKKYQAIKYVSDFKYIKDGKTIVEDSKGFSTKEFLIKKKMFLYIYPDIEFIVS